ncbi:MAG: 23S rRNA (pseudouridine(1915)-N(3))-methyltransferase RlmH [Bacteroidota bacterium]
MKIKLIFTGATQEDFVSKGIEKYSSRLKHYADIEIIETPERKYAKSISETQIKNIEAELILKKIAKSDYLVLLDENGTQLSSKEFSNQVQKFQLSGFKTIIFLIGGAYGFSDDLYQRANMKIALSKMTFTHQFARLILIEQLYRAFTILKNEPYHHE